MVVGQHLGPQVLVEKLHPATLQPITYVSIICIPWGILHQEEHIHNPQNKKKSMAKSPMDTLQLSCIQIAIALLLFTQAKSTTYKTSAHPNDKITSCIASERSALLTFRAGLSDPASLLSSWKGDDCCRWYGVDCGT